MQKSIGIDSLFILEIARKLFPDAKKLSVKQRECALLRYKISEEGARQGLTAILLSLAAMCKMIHGETAWRNATPEVRKAWQKDLKNYLHVFVHAAANLGGEYACTVTPVNETAPDVQDAGEYPPPVRAEYDAYGHKGPCAADLLAPPGKIWGAAIETGVNGTVSSAWTARNKHNATAKLNKSIATDEKRTLEELYSPAVLLERDLPTRVEILSERGVTESK